MKKLYFIILLLSAGFANASLPDSIPNSGFEQWSTTGWFDYPTGWMTNNSQLLAAVVIKDTLSHSGNLAMRLTNQGALRPHAWCGFPLTNHPINFGGYIRSLLFNNDSGEIHVRLFYNQQMIDSGYTVIYNGIFPIYNSFVVSISQQSTIADSCVISMEGGTLYLSDILYDDLQFDFFLNTSEIKKTPFKLYPNPCSSRVIMLFDRSNFYPEEVYAINTLGQQYRLNIIIDDMKQEDYIYYLPQGRNMVVDLEMLNEGVWIIVVKNKNEIYTSKLIKK